MTTKNLPATRSGMKELARVGVPEEMMPAVRQSLASVGIVDDDQVAEVIAIAISVGMEPEALVHPANLRTLRQARDFCFEYNGVPGQDFYLVPFGGASGSDDDDGGGSGARVKKYAFIRSVNNLDMCVHASAAGTGISYRFMSKVIPPERVDEYLEIYAHAGYIKSPHNRVVIGLYAMIVGGQFVPPDWETASVGYYLHEGVKGTNRRGVPQTYGKDSVNLSTRNPGRTGVEVARTRAQRNAAKQVTREIFRVSGMTAERRMELTMLNVQRRLEGRSVPSEAMQLDTAAALSEIADGEYTDIPQDDGQGQDPPEAGTPTPTAESEVHQSEPKPKKKGGKGKQAAVVEPEFGEEPAVTDDGSGDAAEGLNWNDVTTEIYDGLPPSVKALFAEIAGAVDGEACSPASMDRVRDWVAGFTGKPVGEEVADGVLTTDAVIAVIFPSPVGKPVNLGSLHKFLQGCGQIKRVGGKDTWVQSESSTPLIDAIKLVGEEVDKRAKTF